MTKFSYFLFISVLLSACGMGNEKQNKNNTETTHSEEYTNKSTSQTTIYLNDANNVSIGEISMGSEVIINLGDIHVYRKMGSSGKAKYLDKQGNILAKVNVYEDGIKLKRENGDMLYKVKVYERKIKVATDSEMTNPFEIKTKHSTLFKIYKQGNEVGSVIFKNNIAQIESGHSIISAMGLRANKISGIFALNEIEMTYRSIIVAELLLNNF